MESKIKFGDKGRGKSLLACIEAKTSMVFQDANKNRNLQGVTLICLNRK